MSTECDSHTIKQSIYVRHENTWSHSEKWKKYSKDKPFSTVLSSAQKPVTG